MTIVEANVPQVIQRYFEAWNRHDTAAILSTFSDDGTYKDPTTGSENLSGCPIAAHARHLLDAFPDLFFEITEVIVSGNKVAAQWVLHGRNSGNREGKPPTYSEIALPGFCVLAVRNTRISSAEVYYDQKTLLEQLGYNVIAYKY